MTRLCREHGLSQRHACRLVGIDHSTLRYQARRADDQPIRQRLRELAAVRHRFGYRRLGWLLVREGYRMNHKRLYRLYREEKLSMKKIGIRFSLAEATVRRVLREEHIPIRNGNHELPQEGKSA